MAASSKYFVKGQQLTKSRTGPTKYGSLFYLTLCFSVFCNFVVIFSPASTLQLSAIFGSHLQYFAITCSILQSFQYFAVYVVMFSPTSTLQSSAIFCSHLQYFAITCSILQYFPVFVVFTLFCSLWRILQSLHYFAVSRLIGFKAYFLTKIPSNHVSFKHE